MKECGFVALLVGLLWLFTFVVVELGETALSCSRCCDVCA